MLYVCKHGGILLDFLQVSCCFFIRLVIRSTYKRRLKFRCLEALARPRHITRGRGRDTLLEAKAEAPGSEAEAVKIAPRGEAVPPGTTTLVSVD